MNVESLAYTIKKIKRKNVACRDEYALPYVNVLIDNLNNSSIPTVDITQLIRNLPDVDSETEFGKQFKSVMLPWDRALFCYSHEHVNVLHVVMSCDLQSLDEIPTEISERINLLQKSSNRTNPNAIRWLISVDMWIDNQTKNIDHPVQVGFGNIDIAVDSRGDFISSMRYADPDDDVSSYFILFGESAILHSLTFINCRNISVKEPDRPRAQRKRLARYGVTIKEIVITPIGKSTKKSKQSVEKIDQPLTSVRGHFAEYGQNGKGLLFGKYAGRFWIPQHARGDAAYGESRHNYTLEPD